MRIAYLILAHQYPRHLERLVRALSVDDAGIFIHIDAKVSRSQFAAVEQHEGVRFIDNRVPVSWGGFSDVQATLNLIHAAVASGESFDYFALLSGTHYPLQSQAALKAYLQGSGKEFISVTRVPNEAAEKPIDRFNRFYIDRVYHRRFGLPRAVTTFGARAVNKLKFRRAYEAPLGGLVPHAGWQWWLLSAEAIHYVTGFVAARPEVVRFFRHVLLPDESFFQTIMANSPFRNRLARDLTYTHWQSVDAPHPEFLTEALLEPLYANGLKTSDIYGGSEAFFARKFKDESQPVIRMIDDRISQ